LIAQALLQTGRSTGKVWRIVESQEQAATRSITRSGQDQSRLEQLLDNNKPAYLPGTETLHWLLRTPFRYPPLPHGSRFGSALRPGILYASRELHTAMTESAVYLWLFRAGPVDTGPLHTIRDSRTALGFRVTHRRCANLTRPACEPHWGEISNPGDYQFAQLLGDTLRDNNSGMIWFHSARQPAGINVAVIDPAAVQENQAPQQNHWQIHIDSEACWWGNSDGKAFEVAYTRVANKAGRIPHPAL
jgi:RES domain